MHIDYIIKLVTNKYQILKVVITAIPRLSSVYLLFEDTQIRTISSQSSSGRKNHVTQSSEVAAFIVYDDADTTGIRDTIIQSKINGLQRIFETDPYFMQLQYPFKFPLGNVGFHLHIPLQSPKKPKKGAEHDDVDACEPKHRETVSHKEYYSYKIMIRASEGK